ncbi:EAL domain-containing protein [Rhodococcoides kroppenstedtii]|uniref:EAL domain-containing protein n=1 Tax=Rhodococcoides kroppenstedtii TaxID=293050 RepID=UPI00202FCF64|nr:EAL domain-containing protein [Rhodococcus kroppenstedtii]
MTPALPDVVEVRSLYQPVVDLTTRAMVGVEALARGPAGSPFERPEELFAAARAAGRLREIDWLCRVSALRGALSAPLPPGQLLFVNIEPGVTDGFVPPMPWTCCSVRSSCPSSWRSPNAICSSTPPPCSGRSIASAAADG